MEKSKEWMAEKEYLNDKHQEDTHCIDVGEVVEGKDGKRDTWAGKLDFILSGVGSAVGLGNIWRFPYLCYKNGGGAFLIPYFLFLICGGIPILMLEVGLGQYMSQGGLAAWNICPLFKGIGVATLVVDTLCNVYYILILAWGSYYFVRSFSAVLPWATCDNEWNTERCSVERSTCNASIGTTTAAYVNTSMAFVTSESINCTKSFATVDPTVEFWERKVLQISEGVDKPDGIVPELAVCLLIVWLVVYFCVWRGVKWSGKVVYFTATFPYVVLFALLVRGLTLDGATNGIIYYLKPDLSRLKEPQVWIDGGTQVFYSCVLAFGAMIGLGSYNKFTNNFYRDCTVIACINSGTSLIGGFAVFSVLGFMAKQRNVSIDDVADKGPGLAFITYPKAVTRMPVPQLWAGFFFLMIFLVGLDSQFVAVESFVAHCADLFPRQLYKKRGRMLFTAAYCAVSFVVGLSMVTRGGMYVFQMFDYYVASGMVLLWLCFWESVVIGWIFGAERFYDAIELMIGCRINPWLHICWKYFTPIITAGIFIFQVADFPLLRYKVTYVYPMWAQIMGVALALVSMVCVPVGVVYKLTSLSGSFKERLRSSVTPELRGHQIHRSWIGRRYKKCNIKK